LELTIEKLIYGGDGLARLPADPQGRRKAVFVPLALPGETIEAQIIEENPGFARAQLENVIQTSPDRIAPGCPYFGACGGCHYQHVGYEQQLELKKSILRETIERIAKLELPEITAHPSPPWHYRNRTRMHIHHEPEFAIGYYRMGSRELLPIRECPISAEVINRALLSIWAIGSEIPKEVAEVEFFCSHDQQQLMVELWLKSTPSNLETQFRPVADLLQAALPELASVAVLRQPSRGKESAESVAAPELDANGSAASLVGVFGGAALRYHSAGFDYRVSAGSFFQTNRFLAEELIRLATTGRSGHLAFDLYAGVGLFSLPLAKSFKQVIAVESSPQSVSDLRHNAPSNVRVTSSTTEQFLARKQKQSPDFVLVDPPRGGLSPKIASAIARLGPRQISYVSCDPSTQARDLGPLLKAGYRISGAHLMDLFPQTYHIESLLHLVR
jgi:23S rRNA (uracil1939-C5)-methyltransferase